MDYEARSTGFVTDFGGGSGRESLKEKDVLRMAYGLWLEHLGGCWYHSP